jgi:hypothetical protein
MKDTGKYDISLSGEFADKTLEKEIGGAFPKLRYFTSIVRWLCVAENYSQLFRLSVSERKNIGFKI